MTQEKNSNELAVENSPSEQFFMRDVGISEAEKLTGKNKGKISVDSNNGRLRFTLNEKGNRRYKIADLFELYGLKNPDKTVSKELKKLEEPKNETFTEMALLKQQVQYQAEQLRRSEDEIRYLRDKQDLLIEQNNRLTMLLPSLTPKVNMPEQNTQADKPLSFWKRLFS